MAPEIANAQILEGRAIGKAVKISAPSSIRLPSSPKEKSPADQPSGSEVESPQPSEKLKKRSVRRGLRWIIRLPWKLFPWIPGKLNYQSLKPVIRSAIAAWVALILLIVPQTERAMGQASFFVVIASFLSPPNEPFIAIFEREFFIGLFVCLAWAWCCFGIKMASLARSDIFIPTNMNDVFIGDYIEAGPAIISAVFFTIGAGVFLYVKARLGAGPFALATVFACITMNISFTTAHFYPYPNYKLPQLIVIPVAIHTAISLTTSLLIFPQSIHSQFTSRLRLVLTPLSNALSSQPTTFSRSPFSDEFNTEVEAFQATIKEAEAGLLPLAASSRFLKMTGDVGFGKFSGMELRVLHDMARKVVLRANGLGFFYRIIDPLREPLPNTPATSGRATPVKSPPSTPIIPSRPPSIAEDANANANNSIPMDSKSFSAPPSVLYPRAHSSGRRSHQSHLHWHIQKHLPHFPHLTHRHHHHTPDEEPVGTFESHLLMNLESRMYHPNGDRLTIQATNLLGVSVRDLIRQNVEALEFVERWLERVNKSRWFWWREVTVVTEEGKREEVVALERALDEFRKDRRMAVLEPYRPHLDPNYKGGMTKEDAPPHRYLFHSFVYQYHLAQFTKALIELMQEIRKLDQKETKPRFWRSGYLIKVIFTWRPWQTSENTEGAEDEDPEDIPGIPPDTRADAALGEARRRNPDALPPSNIIQWIGGHLHDWISQLGRGNALFGMKAAVLSLLLALPSFIRSSAPFAYKHKFIWAIFIGQLTLARFRGETAFGWVARVRSTFIGACVGLAIWYITAGNGGGNPWALAVVCAICFPFFMLFRIYSPAPPMQTMITFVTVVLIVGYSWQDSHQPTFSSQGWGWSIAWRRFLLVTIGVTAAFIFSILPPTTTLRQYVRTSLSTTLAEIGSVYCSIISWASEPEERDRPDLVKSLLAVRAKLKRIRGLKANVSYELTLRGSWPAERWERLLDVQLDIAYLLGHLFTVTNSLDPAWKRAYLSRTRFLDAEFLGDFLAIISLCSTALKTGYPLPQITPAPLLDRFLAINHGLDVLRHGNEDEFGVPKKVTIETMEDEQYLYFTVGVSTAYGIVTRLDRLMFAVKELVGERYHIEGVLLPLHNDTWNPTDAPLSSGKHVRMKAMADSE